MGRPAQQDVRAVEGPALTDNSVMPINFYDILGDDDWEPWSVDRDDPANLWYEGSRLADAPVDVKATIDGNIWTATAMDPEFRMKGFRMAPNFTFPRRSQNQHKLIIVLGGQVEIEYEDKDGKEGSERVTGPGGFFVVDEGTPHAMTAGPDGARFTEQWDYNPPAKLETTWFDVGWVHR